MNSLTREEIWKTIATEVEHIEGMRSRIRGNVKEISINERGVSLRYQINENRSVWLELNSLDLRTASFTALTYGKYEGLLEDLIFAFCTNANCMLDIGSNIGFYSIGAAILNPNLDIFSIEPNPKIFEELQRNVAANDLVNVPTLINKAVSQFPGNLNFYVPRFTGSGGGSLKNLHPEEGEPITFKVQALTLPEIIPSVKTIDLIKIDVEGAELSVIKSALELIQKSKPTIIIELLRKWMEPFEAHPQEVMLLLQNMGYKVFGILASKIVRAEYIDEETQETNFVFVHPQRSVDLKFIEAILAKNECPE